MGAPIIDGGRIDRQHEFLFTLIDVYKNKKNISEVEISSASKALYLWAMEHGVAEEDIMKADSYPGIHIHSAEHTNIFEMCKAMVLAGSELKFDKLIQNVEDVIIQHIKTHDVKWAEWRQAKYGEGQRVVAKSAT